MTETAEKCGRCHLFVEANDPEDPDTAAYVHLTRGDAADEAIEATHEATPSGDVRSLAEWKVSGPPEMLARFESVEPVVFVNQGSIGGVEYVDVVYATGDPIEYAITLAEAEARYGSSRKVANPGQV